MDTLPFRTNRLTSLARELAMDIHDVPSILQAHKISPEDFETIKQSPEFQTALDQMVMEWTSATNTEKRVKFKSQSSIEESLLSLHAAANDATQPLNHRVLALQFLAKLGGLGAEEKDTKQAERFSITINMGNTPTIIEARAEPVTIEAD